MQSGWIFWAELLVITGTSAAYLGIGHALCRRRRWARPACIVLGSVALGYRILTSAFPDRYYIELPYLLLAGVIAPA